MKDRFNDSYLITILSVMIIFFILWCLTKAFEPVKFRDLTKYQYKGVRL